MLTAWLLLSPRPLLLLLAARLPLKLWAACPMLASPSLVTALNPGSCGKRRFDQEITLAILTVDGSTLSTQKVVIQP